MKKWQTQYYSAPSNKPNEIEEWLDRLDAIQLKSVAKELKMLEIAGNTLKMPHSKPLGQGLFELRERRYGYRIYYCFSARSIVVLLAVGDKKSQERDIKVARERLKEIMRDK
jgi:putative addiction module killer protein